MNISKAGQAACGSTPDSEDLALIRSYARGDVAAEDLYVFPLILCDNDIDRDFERFDEQTIEDLAKLYPGKTGISDHEWRSGNQLARIYKTELLRDEGRRTADGRPYVALKAWAYMLRSQANAAVIEDIEAGIRKEVSVGCAVTESRCSICGQSAGTCTHVKGQHYDGQVCCHVLTGAVDAYEWSFVAVPAQRGAGVTKQLAGAPCDARLAQEAALGRQYLAQTRSEVKRLALLCGKDLHDALSPTLEAMEPQALLGLRAALEKRAAEKLPIRSQFPAGEDALRFDGAAYQV